MKFRIPVTWTEYGVYTVEAESLDAACSKVLFAEDECEDLPYNGEFVDNSMEINMDMLKELNTEV